MKRVCLLNWQVKAGVEEVRACIGFGTTTNKGE
jgi:hypothetical protein